MREDRLPIEVVKHVADLARLELGDDELHAFRDQLARVLDYMAELDAVSVEGIPPTFHSVRAEPRLRDDEVSPCLSREEALSNAPRVEAGGFAVPRVLPEGKP